MKTIHNVHILDRSGSMLGGKYDNAIKGINNELRELNGHGKIRYTGTVIEFSGINDKCVLKQHYFMENKFNVEPIVGAGAKGMTPLNEAVGKVLELVSKKKQPTDQVIVTIFTDGYENSSKGKYAKRESLKELISNLEDNHKFTVTFAGVKEDVEKVIRDLDISFGNTFIHENTRESVEKFYKQRSKSLASYSSSNSETTDNFFKA